MDEIAGLCTRGEFTVRAPTHVAYARHDICDGLLHPVMVNPRASARLDLEHAAPHRRIDAELRRNRGLAFRTGRLLSALVEFTRMNDTKIAEESLIKLHPGLSLQSSLIESLLSERI